MPVGPVDRFDDLFLWILESMSVAFLNFPECFFVDFIGLFNIFFIRYMYWAEWGQSGSIKKACMDGTNRTTVVSNSGHAVFAIHNELQRLYWTDLNGNSSVIKIYDLTVLSTKVLVNESNTRITALTIYKNHLFWSDEINGKKFKVHCGTTICGQLRLN